SKYEQALNGTESDLKTALSGTPLDYNYEITYLATGGWCVYRSPAPYADEYKGYLQTVCTDPSTIITLPPTPSYNDFVKWGEAKPISPLLSSPYFPPPPPTIALGLSIALPLAAQVAAGIPIYLAAARFATVVAFAIDAAATIGQTTTPLAVAATATAEGAA